MMSHTTLMHAVSFDHLHFFKLVRVSVDVVSGGSVYVRD